MKKLLSMLLAVVVFIGCSKEDENPNQLENIITSMGQSQLSAIDVLASVECWQVKIIYQYTEAGGKGDSKLYYDPENMKLEGASRGANYRVADGNIYELRSHPLSGIPYYYTYALSGAGNSFSLVRKHDSLNKTMNIVAYDDKSMVIEFYNPVQKEYPYSREYIVRWNPNDEYWDMLTAYEDLPENEKP
ncbi:MAG: hypothetical protein IKC78_00820 [Alistipes sp.]|nr:hypothetical protein [Alistipes sp.]